MTINNRMYRCVVARIVICAINRRVAGAGWGWKCEKIGNRQSSRPTTA